MNSNRIGFTAKSSGVIGLSIGVTYRPKTSNPPHAPFATLFQSVATPTAQPTHIIRSTLHNSPTQHSSRTTMPLTNFANPSPTDFCILYAGNASNSWGRSECSACTLWNLLCWILELTRSEITRRSDVAIRQLAFLSVQGSSAFAKPCQNNLLNSTVSSGNHLSPASQNSPHWPQTHATPPSPDPVAPPLSKRSLA